LLVNMALNIDKLSDSIYYVVPGSGYGDSKEMDEVLDKKNIAHHYDVGNDFYRLFLTDPLMTYSCGIWATDKTTLTDAQYNKINIIIKKMNPKPNQKILDIGCGWGKIAKYVADKTNTHVTGITVSEKQAQQARQMLQMLQTQENINSENNNNKNNIDVMVMDYRNLNQQYDHMYSIGMFEHVRYENYDAFFQMIKRCLVPNGRFVLHTIITLDKNPRDEYKVMESFINKYVFPAGQIPTSQSIIGAAYRSNLKIIHTEIFGGQHYAKTLHTWRENMLKNREYIKKHYSDELVRKYDYYFAYCRAGFAIGSHAIGHFIITNQEVVNLTNNFVCL
jgi:cyclopropane-fatty-acyl-phospholipid synthase